MKRKHLILIALALLAFSMACKEVAVEERDKKVLIQVGDLEPYGVIFENAAKYEKFTKTRYFDNSFALEYEFETPEGAEPPFYMMQTVSIENKRSDARFSKDFEEVGVSLGLKVGGVELEKKNDFYTYGDSSNFYVLKVNGKPGGNYFTTQVGKKSFSLLIAGLYFDDVEEWRELVEPKLKEFSSYNP